MKKEHIKIVMLIQAIGFDVILNIINHPKLKEVPKILETPYIEDYPPYKFEIKSLREGKFNSTLKEDIITYYKKL